LKSLEAIACWHLTAANHLQIEYSRTDSPRNLQFCREVLEESFGIHSRARTGMDWQFFGDRRKRLMLWKNS
jgi:hypothetical protein